MNWAKRNRLRRERKVQLAREDLSSEEQHTGRQRFDAPEILSSIFVPYFTPKLIFNPVTTVPLHKGVGVWTIIAVKCKLNVRIRADNGALFIK